VNDAATLPASLRGLHLNSGRQIEVRLAMPLSEQNKAAGAPFCSAKAIGQPTERRAAPPQVKPGGRLEFLKPYSAPSLKRARVDLSTPDQPSIRRV